MWYCEITSFKCQYHIMKIVRTTNLLLYSYYSITLKVNRINDIVESILMGVTLTMIVQGV